MAKTFYGYAEREAGSYVDWSQIGKDITDMLQEEVVRRETLKKELADASTAYGEVLSNAPTGLHEGANDAIISFADNAQQARLMQDRLLKSGQLKVKDYLLQRENLTQGTKGIFNVAKNFQEKVDYKVERMKNNESQYLEQYLFELTEGFGNFNKAGIYINPTNFEVSAAKKVQKTGPNGEVYYEMSNDPKDFLTTNEMNNFISVDLDRFDDTKAVEDLSSQVGARLQQDYIYDKGRKSFITRAISDASGDVFQKMVEKGELTEDEINLVNRFRGQVDKEFDSWLSNPFNVTSTLTESLGEKFTFVWKEEDQKGNPNAILLEKDPNSGFVKPVFNTDEGKAQIDKIKEVWGERLRLRLDQEVKEVGKQEIVKVPTPDPDRRKQNAFERRVQPKSRDIQKYMYGTDEEKIEALTSMADWNDEVKQYRHNSTGDLVADVYVDEKRDQTKEVMVFRDPLNPDKAPEDLLREAVNSNTLNYFSESERQYLNEGIESFAVDGWGAYGLDKKRLRGLGEVIATVQEEGMDTPTVLDVEGAAKTLNYESSKTRQIYDEAGEVTQGAEGVYREVAEKKSVNDPVDMIQALTLTYLGGQNTDEVPLRRPHKLSKGKPPIQLTPIKNADELFTEGVPKDLHAANIRYFYAYKATLDPRYGESFLMPVAEVYWDKQPAIMQFIEDRKIAIDAGKSNKKITKEEIASFLKDAGDIRYKGYGAEEYFRKYNRMGEAQQTQSSAGKSR